MRFLNRQKIIRAIEAVEADYSNKQEPIIYELKFEGRFYSPLQVVNLAYDLELDESSKNKIYNVEQAINVLEDLDFEIIESNKIWKFGCNWGSGKPSFYEVIKKEKVVLDWEQFKTNDLILITEGFTVRALGRILDEYISIEKKVKLMNDFQNYSVLDDVNINKIEFYELPKVDIFTYELQQGIVNVRKKEVRYNAINLWLNKDKKEVASVLNGPNNYMFRSYFYRNNSFEDWKYPCIGLRHLTNEKNGVRNSFQMTHFLDEKKRIEIGVVLIHMRDNYITELETQFNFLDTRYCSIGTTVEFYQRLVETLPNQYDEILKNLNDIARNPDVRRIFENDIDIQSALLSTSEAEYILNNYNEIILSDISDKSYQFSYAVRILEAITDHNIDFTFQSTQEIENRFFCIVGKNATGKTKFISNLANKLADNNDKGTFSPKRPPFSKVIAASFSYFDVFRTPAKVDTNYEFIGIRNKKGQIVEDDYFQILWESFKNIVYDKEKFDLWFNSIENTIETSHLSFDLILLQDIKGKEDFREKTDAIFSSGQNIAFQFLTRFIESLDYNSLLIFDEPENHLHPNIVGRLLRTINDILIEYKSYAILATHSPIILQEIPSRFIRVIDRVENTPVIYQPTIECYGENLSEISNSIFGTDVEKELYKKQFEDLVDNGKTYKEIDSLFENKLSLNARIFIKTIEK